jgi:hypothetical protein
VRLQAVGKSAGEAFLGANWEPLVAEASEAWRKKVAQKWRDHHHELQESARRLADLRAAPDALAVRIEVARLTSSLQGAEAALEQLRKLRTEAPEDVRVAFQLATLLAGLQDAKAFAELEALASRAPGYARAAAVSMRELALAFGDQAAADGYEKRIRAAEKKQEAAEKALAEAANRGLLAAHGLPDHSIALLTKQLQSDGLIAGAYLAAVQPGEVTAFGGLLLVIRIDPRAMERVNSDPITITERCLVLASRFLEPNQFAFVLNFYITEAVDRKIGKALSAIPATRLYGNLDSPEGITNDW